MMQMVMSECDLMTWTINGPDDADDVKHDGGRMEPGGGREEAGRRKGWRRRRRRRRHDGVGSMIRMAGTGHD
eukprot:3432410-Pyramimonas_sp.AAC.2